MFGRHKGELVKEVVLEALRELKRNSLVVTDCLVGIDDHVEKLMKLFTSDVRIVGIHGMGGIGKTTIAKVIYNQLSQHFQPHCCLLEDVRATTQQQNGLVHLQKQLISDILKLRRPDLISNKDDGINAIKDRFSGKKVLVVVDDADHRDQLHALALGKEVWKGTLKKLEVIPIKHVQDKLKISYDALEYDQQPIFLDIACFLIGVDGRIAFHMWDDCKFYPEIGIEVLINMSLVKIGDNNELRMHDQLRDLGRDIVRQENVEEPGKRSRVWFHEEAIAPLERHAIATKLKVLNITCCKKMVSTPDFSAYTTLERLILEDSEVLEHIDPSIRKLNSLVFLNMKNCAKLKSLPREFDEVEALTELLIDGTRIEEVPVGRGVMKKLETLSATRCKSLTQISTSIGHLTSLLDLTFDGSSGITKLPDSIGSLVNLRRLSLRDYKLKELPDSIGKLESLIELDLSSTAITELPDTIGNLNRLRILKMESGLIVKLPSTIGMLLKLEELHASRCSSLVGEIPSNFGGLSSLRILRLDSTRICHLPTSICGLSNLQTLYLGYCENLEFVPDLPSSLVFLKVTCRSMQTFLDLCSLVNL
ncbi:disease resistance protein RUN1-like [Cornus florida]|uniref:disease resistance protein RUN1-like n=1 Tax=Cornus florida TaxID=4283 RepID=UPI002897AED8|nr:disease resistance protein RUN1-like [Cornus florida]